MSAEVSHQAFFERLAARAGTPALADEEAALVLRITKVVAEWSERRFAPLTAYAAGLMIGGSAGADAGDAAPQGAPEAGPGAAARTVRLRELLASIETLAAEDARG